MDEEILHYVKTSDPLSHTKYTSIQSHNQIVELIKENKREIYNKWFYVFSLYSSILTTIYFQSLSLLYFFIISNIFAVFLIQPTQRFYVRRRKLAEKKYEIEKNLGSLGILLD